MRAVERLRYSVYVVLLDESVGSLPQMRRRNPKRDPLKPCIYVGITPLRVGRRFDFRGATPKYEWRVHHFGVGLMPELYEDLNPMMPGRALQTARKLADGLRAKGFGVANGTCTALNYTHLVSRRLDGRFKSFPVLEEPKMSDAFPEVQFHENARLVYRPRGLINEAVVNGIITVIEDIEVATQVSHCHRATFLIKE